MRLRSYNKELKTSTSMLIDVFNNIVIDRRDRQDNIQKQIAVPCLYGTRSRILKSTENRGKTLKPPLIAISITNIARDETRVHSVNDELRLEVGGYGDIKNKVGIPVNIDYKFSVVTKFQEDMDQIYGNFVPFMNPDIYVVWPHPNGLGNIKSQIIWQGDFSIEYPEEIDPADPWRVYADATFTFKTWIFPGLAGKQDDAPLIKQINFCDGTILDEFGEVHPATHLNKFYEVPNFMSVDEYREIVEDGQIEYPNYDFLQLSAELDNYWMDVYGILSGTVLNPKLSGELITLLDNIDNPHLKLQAKGGLLADGIKNVDFADLWENMLSGNLSACFDLNDFDSTVSAINVLCSSAPIEDNPDLQQTYFISSTSIEFAFGQYCIIGQVDHVSDCTWTGCIAGTPLERTRGEPFTSEATLVFDDNKFCPSWRLEFFGGACVLKGISNPSVPMGLYKKQNQTALVTTSEVLLFCIKLLEDGTLNIYEASSIQNLEDCEID